jgi:hypothetical protein
MDNQLRPLNLGEILDRTAELYRRNFWLFVGTAALPLLCVFALATPVGAFLIAPAIAGNSAGQPSSAQIAIVAVLVLIAVPVYLAVYVYSYAGITQAAVSVYHGQKPTIRATLKSVHPRFWTYLWYVVLQGILVALVPATIAMSVIMPLIYFMSRPDVDFGSRFALGFLIFLFAAAILGVMIWLTLSYAMGMAACVVERKTAWTSLLRSWHLSPGARGRIFVTQLLVAALAFGIGMALAIPVLILVAVLPSMGISVAHSSAAFVVMEIVRVALDFISQVLLAPVFMIATVLFYFDQRIRREAYDIEWMMQQAGLTQPPSLAPPLESTGEFPPATPPDTVGER